MELEVVFNSGSGTDKNVERAFLVHTASGDLETRLVEGRDLHPNDLVVVYSKNEEKPDEDDVIEYDEQDGRVWSYLEQGSIVEGRGEEMKIQTTEGEETVGNHFEYKKWAGEKDVTVVDSEEELKGQVSRVTSQN